MPLWYHRFLQQIVVWISLVTTVVTFCCQDGHLRLLWEVIRTFISSSILRIWEYTSKRQAKSSSEISSKFATTKIIQKNFYQNYSSLISMITYIYQKTIKSKKILHINIQYNREFCLKKSNKKISRD